MGLVYQDNSKHHIEARKSIIVWLYNARDQYKLRHFGDIVYFSRKNKYVIIYLNAEQVDQTINSLKKEKFVKKVERSQQDNLNFSAEYEEKFMEDLRLQAEEMLDKGETLN
ncbi:DUF2129 domain-containing protein [Lactobacillus sp. PV034]|uniref:DUF2129 domain-containing protein n=1 Tax=Lactobacillus sp. PV034 TaxID=2594495 RepID=UPI00223F9C1E|nr:DUF2129 domain-containing protein [Lactobacillus sp. PV034]QNQ80585.1 DUF2129 domain-containing protein [Lactobacillus sp. PV034]